MNVFFDRTERHRKAPTDTSPDQDGTYVGIDKDLPFVSSLYSTRARGIIAL
jgi:hypothetical protein